MEREILFRGKTKAITGCPYNNGKDGEWVFGYVFSDLGAMKIRQYETDRPECNDYEVDPETVGQYTGVTDKNGTKIFEGDIIESVSRLVNSVGTPTGGTDISRYIIEWGEHKWVKKIFFCNRGDCWKRNNVLPEDLYTYTASRYSEVIGNIYDSPALLGKAAKDIAADAAQSGLAPATKNFELMEG